MSGVVPMNEEPPKSPFLEAERWGEAAALNHANGSVSHERTLPA